MIREHMAGRRVAGEEEFEWRGGDIKRLEGFSDAVFAFALTLLVVSLEVPKTYHELMEAIRGFAAFGVCFAILAQVWYGHYRFFRRYGLQNPWTVFLNCVLLFFVLFYVYPLKFLFSVVFSGGGLMDEHEARVLFVIYGAGFAAISLIFALLYIHAWKHREQLALNGIERLRTRHTLTDHFAMVVVGLASAALAVMAPARWIGTAGWFYFVIGIYYTVTGMIYGKRERVLKEKLSAIAMGAAESKE
jgi:uncharacterized membrane protein